MNQQPLYYQNPRDKNKINSWVAVEIYLIYFKQLYIILSNLGYLSAYLLDTLL